MSTPAHIANLEAQVLRRDRYLQGVVEMQLRLLTTKEDGLGALNHTLAPLGEAAGADRVYIFANDRDEQGFTGRVSQVAEWCPPHIEPQIDNPDLQHVEFEGTLPAWFIDLRAGRGLTRLASEFDEVETMLLQPQGILSLLVLPLLIDEQLTGFIGFDNCHEEARWSAGEVALLQAAASQISLNLEQRRARRDLQELNATLEARVAARTAELAAQNVRLRDAQEQLVQREKLAALGGLVAGIAHEINTPLGVSVTAVSHAADRLVALDGAIAAATLTRGELRGFVNDLRESVGLARENLDRAGRLVQSFKKVAVDQTSESSREVFLDDLVADVVTSLLPLTRQAHVTPEVRAEVRVLVRVDASALIQVLTNLVQNACLHAFDGVEGERRLTITTTGDHEWVTMLVADNGVGMAPEVAARVFEPFFTTRRSAGGSGLGMHIAHNLVTQRFGGELSLTTAPGQGACWTLRLPMGTPALSRSEDS